jgi:hypothetical protein
MHAGASSSARLVPFPSVIIRVTRLGKFSPNMRLLALGGFLKMTELARIFVLIFFLSMDYELNLP